MEPQEWDVPEADACVDDFAGIRVALVRLGPVGTLMFEGVREMFAHFRSVQMADLVEVGGAAAWKSAATASGCGGRLVIKYVKSTSHSAWRKLVVSKKVFAVVALIHPRHGDVKQFQEHLQAFQTLRQQVEIAWCMVIDPDPSLLPHVDPLLSKCLRVVPWDDDYRQRQSRVAQITNDILAGVMQSIHYQAQASKQGGDSGKSGGVTGLGRSKQASSTAGPQRALKAQADVAALRGDYKSAMGTYKEAADRAERAGDILCRAAALEGLACALVLYKLFLCGGGVKENAAGDPQWREDVTSSFRQALTLYDSRDITPPCLTLRIEAGLRYARFLTAVGEDRSVIAGVVTDVYFRASLITDPLAVFLEVSEMLMACGYHRKAVCTLRQAANRADIAGLPLRALHIYFPALRIMGVPVAFDGLTFTCSENHHQGQQYGGAKSGGPGATTNTPAAGATSSVTSTTSRTPVGRSPHAPPFERWDVLQYQILKEMLQVAKKLDPPSAAPPAPFRRVSSGSFRRGAGGGSAAAQPTSTAEHAAEYSELYYQLAMFTLFHYGHVGDKQWAYGLLLDLSRCAVRDVVAIGRTLPCEVAVRPLPAHLAPQVRHVQHGRANTVFQFNPFLAKMGADAVVWAAGATGEVRVTLHNVLGLHLHIARVAVVPAGNSVPARVIGTEYATVAPHQSVTVAVGVQPLAVGNLKIEAVRVVLHEEGRALPALTVPLDPPLSVAVVRPLPLLVLTQHGGTRQAVDLQLLTGEVARTTLVLRNTGTAAIETLVLAATQREPAGEAGEGEATTAAAAATAPPAVVPSDANDTTVAVTYDAAAVQRRLPLPPGGVIEVDVDVMAPAAPPQGQPHTQKQAAGQPPTPVGAGGGPLSPAAAHPRTFGIDFTAVYGAPETEQQFVSTEAFKNIDGRWDSYVLFQRKVVLPATVVVSCGLCCTGARVTPDGRFVEATIHNASKRMIHLVNSAYKMTYRTVPPVYYPVGDDPHTAGTTDAITDIPGATTRRRGPEGFARGPRRLVKGDAAHDGTGNGVGGGVNGEGEVPLSGTDASPLMLPVRVEVVGDPATGLLDAPWVAGVGVADHGDIDADADADAEESHTNTPEPSAPPRPLPEHVVKVATRPFFLPKVRGAAPPPSAGDPDAAAELAAAAASLLDVTSCPPAYMPAPKKLQLLAGATTTVLLPAHQFVDEAVEVIECPVDEESLDADRHPTVPPPVPRSKDGSVTLRCAKNGKLVATVRRVRRGYLGELRAPTDAAGSGVYLGNITLPWTCQSIRALPAGCSEKRFTSGSVSIRRPLSTTPLEAAPGAGGAQGTAFSDHVPKAIRPPHGGTGYAVVEDAVVDTEGVPRACPPARLAVAVAVREEAGDDEREGVEEGSTGSIQHRVHPTTLRPCGVPLAVAARRVYVVDVSLVCAGGGGETSACDAAAPLDVSLGFAARGRDASDALEPAPLGSLVMYEGPLTPVPLQPGGAAHTVCLAVHDPGAVYLQVQVAMGGARLVYTFPIECSRDEGAGAAVASPVR